MAIVFGILAVASAAAERIDMNKIPVVSDPVAASEMRVPVGDSLRAATWDELTSKPSQPVRVQLACIVMAQFGAPGNCVPAALIPSKQATVDWAKIVEADRAAHASDGSVEFELRLIAARRIAVARVAPQFGRKDMFAIRFFEETVSPTDARSPFAPGGAALTINDVTPTRPLDGALLQALYPVAALRNGVSARVRVTCRIEPDLKPLCRDPATITMSQTAPEALVPALQDDFRFATYQFASTLQLQPRTKDGQPVAGRDISIAMVWTLP